MINLSNHYLYGKAFFKNTLYESDEVIFILLSHVFDAAHTKKSENCCLSFCVLLNYDKHQQILHVCCA